MFLDIFQRLKCLSLSRRTILPFHIVCCFSGKFLHQFHRILKSTLSGNTTKKLFFSLLYTSGIGMNLFHHRTYGTKYPLKIETGTTFIHSALYDSLPNHIQTFLNILFPVSLKSACQFFQLILQYGLSSKIFIFFQIKKKSSSQQITILQCLICFIV